MNPETRICQNCKQSFTIEAEDFDFYRKISVPPPTFCHYCRLQRRLAFRNERSLYRRKCDLCKKDIIARYSPDVPVSVYCVPCWYSDNWDPLAYGQEYDFSKPFFTQFAELCKKVPHPALYTKNAVNSEYANQSLNIKNVYFSTSILNSEDVYYSYRVDRSKDVYDVSYCWEVEQCYDLIDGITSNRLLFSRYVKGSLDSEFLYDVRGSNDCFSCVNLRNTHHQIFNKQFLPDEYKKERQKYDLGSFKKLNEVRNQFEVFRGSFPKRFAMLDQTVNVIGDNVRNAKNCFWCFDSNNLEDCKYCLAGTEGAKDCYDCNHLSAAAFCYESWSVMGNMNKFGMGAFGQNIEYSEFCPNAGCSNLFGCVSINTKKDYCILNKAYSKKQ